MHKILMMLFQPNNPKLYRLWTVMTLSRDDHRSSIDATPRTLLLNVEDQSATDSSLKTFYLRDQDLRVQVLNL